MVMVVSCCIRNSVVTLYLRFQVIYDVTEDVVDYVNNAVSCRYVGFSYFRTGTVVAHIHCNTTKKFI